MVLRGESRYMAELGAAAPAKNRKIMASFFEHLTPFALAAVVLVLLLGFVNMMRGGSSNRSQQLMRLRVILQLVAIIIMMTSLYFAAR
jgi:hypothetical protein